MTPNSDTTETRFAVCIRNDGYPASLERRKLYQVLADPVAEQHGLMRVIDESEEDYLYPQSYFRLIEVPLDLREVLSLAA